MQLNDSSVQYPFQGTIQRFTIRSFVELQAPSFVPKVAQQQQQETSKVPVQQEDDKSEVPRRLAIFQNFTKVI